MVTQTIRVLVALGLCIASAAAADVMLLDFSSPYCGPCKVLEPTIAQLERDGYPIQRIDVSQDASLATKYGVDRVPTLLLLVNGQEAKRLIGGASYQELKQLVDQQRTAGPAPAATAATPAAPSVASDPWQTGGAVAPTAGAAGWPTAAASTTPPAGASWPAAAASVTPGAAPAAHVDPTGFEQRLLAATVRIKVEDAQGHSYGTGTIVDTRQGDALVVTCAHLFRDTQGKGPVTVEIFTPTPTGVQVVDRVVGTVESFDLERDVALVSMRPQVPVTPVRVAATAMVDVNHRVWSVGCDRGADPSLLRTRVTAVDRYQGPPNIEAAGAPVVGRSGGGLFSEQGELVGVCFASNEPDNEGLYSALDSIQAELDKLGLAEVYRGDAGNVQLASASAAERKLTPVVLDSTDVVLRGQQPPEVPVAVAGGLSASEQAALLELAQRAQGHDVVCIVRARDPGGKPEVLSLPTASPEFITRLRELQATR